MRETIKFEDASMGSLFASTNKEAVCMKISKDSAYDFKKAEIINFESGCYIVPFKYILDGLRQAIINVEIWVFKTLLK